MKTKWYHTLRGVVAAMGWATLFAYALLRALAGHWWFVIVVLVIAVLAGAFSVALTMSKQVKKGKSPAVFVQQPGVH